MLTDKEIELLKFLQERSEPAILVKLPPVPRIQSLVDRGWLRLSNVVAPFCGRTGEKCVSLTESARAYLEATVHAS